MIGEPPLPGGLSAIGLNDTSALPDLGSGEMVTPVGATVGAVGMVTEAGGAELGPTPKAFSAAAVQV